MKTKIFITAMAAAFMFTFQQCKKDDPQPVQNEEKSVLPANFKVDIPSALSSNQSKANLRTKGDTLSGEEIYKMLNVFIWVGDHSAQVIQDIIMAIGKYNITHAMSITFVSEDDNRTKSLVVIENASYEGVNYEFRMTIADVGFASNPDGGKALQLFWNRNPVNGVAIIKPYNVDYTHNSQSLNTMYRIDYSEITSSSYEKYMVVTVDDLPLAAPTSDPFSVETLKLFAGKNGDFINVYGNSNHPNAKFFNNEVGFNWAFIGSAKESENIAAAEVGLPPSNLNTNNRDTLIKTYAIKKVFENQILSVWPTINPTVLNSYLQNTNAPGFFNNGGFVQAGTTPNTNYDVLISNINALSPYNPMDIKNTTINFQ